MMMSVGCLELCARDEADGVEFPVVVFYPTGAQGREPLPEGLRIGPYLVDAVSDAPVAPGLSPLIVVSHGSGGSHLVYRTLGTFLAGHGYVVAQLEHRGNNRNDNSLDDTVENMMNRPADVKRTINLVFAHDRLGERVAGQPVGMIGHSMGGYTALAVAGGRPCTSMGDAVQVVHDERVRALVLLAPATPWFQAPDALRAVHVPILLLAAEHDPHTSLWHSEVVLKGVAPDCDVEHRVVANAGHFSFLSPFPESMVSPALPPSQDPPGFDRPAFHQRLNRQVLEFLNMQLRD